MLVAVYKTKKALRDSIGKPLRHTETNMYGEEYKPDGTLFVVGPSAYDRKWYAKVHMKGGKINGVQ